MLHVIMSYTPSLTWAILVITQLTPGYYCKYNGPACLLAAAEIIEGSKQLS